PRYMPLESQCDGGSGGDMPGARTGGTGIECQPRGRACRDQKGQWPQESADTDASTQRADSRRLSVLRWAVRFCRATMLFLRQRRCSVCLIQRINRQRQYRFPGTWTTSPSPPALFIQTRVYYTTSYCHYVVVLTFFSPTILGTVLL